MREVWLDGVTAAASPPPAALHRAAGTLAPLGSARDSSREPRPRALVIARSGSAVELEAFVALSGFDVTPSTLAAVASQPSLAEEAALVVVDLPLREPGLLAWTRALADGLGALAPPVVLLDHDPAEEDLAWAFACGAAEVLAKPVAPALLRVKLERVAAGESARRLGPWRLVRLLGRGATATVYQARRAGAGPRGDVALKVVTASTALADPGALERLRREGAALARISSAQVPRFVDVGLAAGGGYCAMEHVPGPTLADLIERGPLTDTQVKVLLVELARALEAVHAAGFVHRDVKPANVIVPPGRPVVLIDLGLVGTPGVEDGAPTGEVVGTARFLSPERVRGGPLAPSADAYALGVTALEAALGRPSREGSTLRILSEVALGLTPQPRQLLPGRCPALVSVLEGLLAPRPSERLALSGIERRLWPQGSRAPRCSTAEAGSRPHRR